MNRREFLKASAGASFLPLLPKQQIARLATRRVGPSDAGWPSEAAWKHLNDDVGGNLMRVDFPLQPCLSSSPGADCKAVFTDLKNPFYIGETPGLTQTLGWVDGWTTKPSVYAVAARNGEDVAAAVKFAREHNLRLAVKGGGHSYQGTSNAPDSLLIWTRHMHDIAIQADFVPQGCQGRQAPQRAVTLGSGAIWLQAYDAVTTKAGAYVQGGGCTTVGVAGLIQSGGFGSFSKHYGMAAAGLLEAEVATADGRVRTANACTNPDLFWALKGGGGGTFGVVSKVTLRVREIPEFGGGAHFTVKAASDDTYRRLVRQFIGFYRDALFNEHFGEQAHFKPENELEISMVHWGLDTEQAKKTWQPFLDWVGQFPSAYTVQPGTVIGSLPFRYWWNPDWHREHHIDVFKSDFRPGASAGNVWWNGDAGQVGWVIWGFESLWMPAAALLQDDSQEKLANALFAASRKHEVELHFNKGLAGAPAEAIAAAKETAMNPAVCDAFALAIIADGQGPAYPGIAGHEPDVVEGRTARTAVRDAMNALRAVAGNGGAYVSEANYFDSDFQHLYWGGNGGRLAEIKKKYDPEGLFIVHNGIGSEQWSNDGFTKL